MTNPPPPPPAARLLEHLPGALQPYARQLAAASLLFIGPLLVLTLVFQAIS